MVWTPCSWMVYINMFDYLLQFSYLIIYHIYVTLSKSMIPFCVLYASFRGSFCLVHLFRLSAPMTWVSDRLCDDHLRMELNVIVRSAITHPCHRGQSAWISGPEWSTKACKGPEMDRTFEMSTMTQSGNNMHGVIALLFS